MELFILSLSALFSILNPIGTLPVFVSLTKDKVKIELTYTAMWTSINTAIILVIAFYVGKEILFFFNISIESLKIAGGVIIASSGFALLTGEFQAHKGMKRKVKEDASTRHDIALTPLAMPMLAGPGSMSLLIAYHQEYPQFSDQVILTLSILAVCMITFILLMTARSIVKILGPSGLNALSRLIGFIVITIGVEYILSTLVKVLDL
ncbi:MAG: NAAT family transporter [Flammeovirgaceae bacterium]|nr:NAAT family transporter [Flammeovirgaceae bacterium]